MVNPLSPTTAIPAGYTIPPALQGKFEDLSKLFGSNPDAAMNVMAGMSMHDLFLFSRQKPPDNASQAEKDARKAAADAAQKVLQQRTDAALRRLQQDNGDEAGKPENITTRAVLEKIDDLPRGAIINAAEWLLINKAASPTSNYTALLEHEATSDIR